MNKPHVRDYQYTKHMNMELKIYILKTFFGLYTLNIIHIIILWLYMWFLKLYLDFINHITKSFSKSYIID